MPQTAQSNDKVTLALLGQKVDTLADVVRTYTAATNERIDCAEGDIKSIQITQGTQGKDIEHLASTVSKWSWGNSIVAGIAMILGYLGINK